MIRKIGICVRKTDDSTGCVLIWDATMQKEIDMMHDAAKDVNDFKVPPFELEVQDDWVVACPVIFKAGK